MRSMDTRMISLWKNGEEEEPGIFVLQAEKSVSVHVKLEGTRRPSRRSNVLEIRALISVGREKKTTVH